MKVYYAKTDEHHDMEGVYLRLDNFGTKFSAPWDDFGYIVTFNAELYEDGCSWFLGAIKFLVKNETNTATFFEKEGEKTKSDLIFDVTNLLNITSSVSSAQELDYYRKVKSIFKTTERVDKYLTTICDASFYESESSDFSTWDGYSETLMRDSSSRLAIFKKGYAIANGRYIADKQFSIQLEGLADSFEPIDFTFDATREIGESRINLLIGKNGVGKTHVLRHLTEIISGLGDEASKWPYFHKLMVIAFSPFENFYTEPQILEMLNKKLRGDSKKKDRNKKRKVMAINEYAYIGFKDEKSLFNVDWPKKVSARSLESILKYDRDNSWWYDSSRLKILFDTLKLSIEFDCIKLQNKKGEPIEVYENSQLDPTKFSSPINHDYGIEFYLAGVKKELSSGQLIYSYMIPSIVSEIEDESLIILDEPELYLHPSMEIGLVEMLRHLLEETSSYAIIASHSAVLAREIEKNSIKILRKNDGRTIISPPSFETYGASLEKISKEVFDDSEIDKPFEEDLNKLIAKAESIENIIEEHANDLGDSALIYLATKTLEGNDEAIEIEIEKES